MASGYYDITNKTLGKGHYGVVKLGRHCLTGEPVAIKIIEKSRLNKDSLNQLGTEIRILFRLSEYEHPNILKLYQTIDSEDKLFLITEYCGPHACDLHDYLSRKHSREGLSTTECQVFFIQICSAISYCHSMGIVHRDLKPENILVTDYKHMYAGATDTCATNAPHYPLLKLIDFGFANQWSPDEMMRTSCGTLAYSAPELLLGEPYDGTKVDVWGLGLMLYILLYGGNPFMQINDNETLTRILDCSFATPVRENVSLEAIELLRSLIRRNPDARLSIDGIMQHKWFSDLPKSIESMLNSPTGQEQPTNPRQLTSKLAPIVSATLPSISESGPLKQLDNDAHDDKVQAILDDTSETNNPNCNRTRSLSITRLHSKTMQSQTLTQTRSSVNLEILNQNNANLSPPPIASRGGASVYRPTSPDVSGLVTMSCEERRIHDRVIQEILRLTKLLDSRSSIEASVKNACFAHRQFNQNSIQPAQYGKRKISTGLLRLSAPAKVSQPTEEMGNAEGQCGPDGGAVKGGALDRLSLINSKLSNDDYIYATYQLTRDRILKVKSGQASSSGRAGERVGAEQDDHTGRREQRASNSHGSIPEEEQTGEDEEEAEEEQRRHNRAGRLDDTGGGVGDSVAKENTNDEGRVRAVRRRLQPQHRMMDKFTSFFRSGSTSPGGSFSVSLDSPSGDSEPRAPAGSAQPPDQPQLVQHEAFSEQNAETSETSSRYVSGKTTDLFESALAYALPLARKCSLVSEESGCSNDLSES